MHRSPGTFNGIWTYLTFEQTFNKDGQTTLLDGIAQKHTATEKYIKSVPFLTKVSEKYQVHGRN